MFSITKVLQETRLFLSARHIQSCLNIVADTLSRPGLVSTEWTHDQAGCETVRALIPTPEIDLLATFEKAILDNFVSPVAHPRATTVDALGLDRNSWGVIYLFPPVSLILKVLVILRSFT